MVASVGQGRGRQAFAIGLRGCEAKAECPGEIIAANSDIFPIAAPERL
jgi:hypothetical protein